MTSETWHDIGPLADFPEGRPILRKAGSHRVACVRAGDRVAALDDLCPHQGYPLSTGSCKDGVLTCEWHNWKFDVASGECLFGGEAVRAYSTRVEAGRVHLKLEIDAAREASRLRASLSKAIERDEMGRGLREALRLGQLAAHPLAGALGPLAAGIELCAQEGARRAEYGFDHGLAALADITTWIERGWIEREPAFVAAMHGVAEPSLHLPARPVARAETAGASPLDPGAVCEALIAERREEAEARVRAIAREQGGAQAARALMPFLARHIYDYGHGAIFVAKALELSERFPAIADDVMGSVALTLAWATAETSLPPFTATRAALARLDDVRSAGEGALELDPAERGAYERAVLSSESAAAGATVDWLARGAAPTALLRAAAHAAAIRIARFDARWEVRLDAEVGVLDITHTLTFAESAIALSRLAEGRDAARLAVLVAAFIGKVRAGDRDDAADPAPRSSAPDLLAAVEARDPGQAIAIARALSPDERRGAYAKLAPFAAFDAATRPIFYAHTIKNTEAMRRLEQADPLADAAYLVALLSYMVPIRRELRARRTAAVANKFLADGRPPEGLY